MTTDSVNHPSHYNMGKFEVIDVIDDWGLGFNLGNAVKYIARARHKGKLVEDLKKAVFYLQHEIEKAEEDSLTELASQTRSPVQCPYCGVLHENELEKELVHGMLPCPRCALIVALEGGVVGDMTDELRKGVDAVYDKTTPPEHDKEDLSWWANYRCDGS